MGAKGERDMILMRHEVTVKWPDNRRELKGINLVSYGDPKGYTAMAKTVGYPCAIATKWFWMERFRRRAQFFHSQRTSIAQCYSDWLLKGSLPMRSQLFCERRSFDKV